MRRAKDFVLKQIYRAGFDVFRIGTRYAQDGLATIHNDGFRSRPEFRAAYRRGLTAGGGVDPGFEWRVHLALWAARTSLRATGDFVECGVNAGFISSAIMQALRWNEQDRRYFLVDTWEGPPLGQYNAQEIARGRRAQAAAGVAAGAYHTDLDRVRANFAEWPNAIVVPGRVPDILPSLPVTEVAFLHLDMNIALPERAALEFFWPRLSPGAMVLLDDYAYRGHELQGAAMDRAAQALGAEIVSLPTGQGLIVR